MDLRNAIAYLTAEAANAKDGVARIPVTNLYGVLMDLAAAQKMIGASEAKTSGLDKAMADFEKAAQAKIDGAMAAAAQKMEQPAPVPVPAPG